MSVKRCTTCGKVKHTDDFYSDKAKSDGLRSLCVQCESERWKNHVPQYRNKVVAPARLHPDWTRPHCLACPMRETCVPLAANMLPVMCELIDEQDVRMAGLRFGAAAPRLLGILDAA